MGNGVNMFGHAYLSILCKTGHIQGSMVKNVLHLKSSVKSRQSFQNKGRSNYILMKDSAGSRLAH